MKFSSKNEIGIAGIPAEKFRASSLRNLKKSAPLKDIAALKQIQSNNKRENRTRQGCGFFIFKIFSD
jgi:hypothetical protein